MKKNVLILREAASGLPKDSRLKNVKIFYIPALSFKKKSIRIPKKKFDFVLLTSKNALRGQKKMPSADTWVFIGAQTKSAYSLKSARTVSLKKSHSKGVVEYFRKHSKKGQSLFFPRSELADPDLVKRLRRLGLKVCVRHTYTMKKLSIRTKLSKLLKEQRMDAVYFTSPSTVDVFVRAISVRECRVLNVQLWSIGPTTAAAVKSRLK